MVSVRISCFILLLSCVYCELYPATSPALVWFGRIQTNTNGSIQMDWSGVQVQFFVSNTTTIKIQMQDANNYYNVFVDGVFYSLFGPTKSNETQYTVASGLNNHENYLIKITKRTEAEVNSNGVLINGIEVDGAIKKFPFTLPNRKIEFLGDSITCGYGNEGTDKLTCVHLSPEGVLENNYETWGAYLGRYFDAQYHIESWSGKGVVRNYGSPNTTSPDPFPIFWNRTVAVTSQPIYDFSLFIPDAVVVNLGTNDYSTEPAPSQQQFEQGYKQFIQAIRSKYTQTVPIFLGCGPMISDPCCTYVQNVVASENNCHYIDLQNILTPTEYGCNGHPNVEGHKKMAAYAQPVISSVMGW